MGACHCLPARRSFSAPIAFGAYAAPRPALQSHSGPARPRALRQGAAASPLHPRRRGCAPDPIKNAGSYSTLSGATRPRTPPPGLRPGPHKERGLIFNLGGACLVAPKHVLCARGLLLVAAPAIPAAAPAVPAAAPAIPAAAPAIPAVHVLRRRKMCMLALRHDRLPSLAGTALFQPERF